MGSKPAKGGGGVFSQVGKIFGYMILAGIGLALLRVFNMDPFGVVGWIWDQMTAFVVWVSDVVSANETFQRVFSKPS